MPLHEVQAPAIAICYEGYELTKAPLETDIEPSWYRVRFERIQQSSDSLRKLALKNLLDSGIDVPSQLRKLELNQQSIVELLLANRQNKEQDGNAEWVLLDVRRTISYVRTFTKCSEECTKIRVILKRQQIHLPGNAGSPTPTFVTAHETLESHPSHRR